MALLPLLPVDPLVDPLGAPLADPVVAPLEPVFGTHMQRVLSQCLSTTHRTLSTQPLLAPVPPPLVDVPEEPVEPLEVPVEPFEAPAVVAPLVDPLPTPLADPLATPLVAPLACPLAEPLVLDPDVLEPLCIPPPSGPTVPSTLASLPQPAMAAAQSQDEVMSTNRS